jgi:MULE transposase domain
MNNKTQKLYEDVFAAIKQVAASNQGKEPAPQLIISDFEIAIMGAAAIQFPSGRARGCWFHFSQVGAKSIFKPSTIQN